MKVILIFIIKYNVVFCHLADFESSYTHCFDTEEPKAFSTVVLIRKQYYETAKEVVVAFYAKGKSGVHVDFSEESVSNPLGGFLYCI